MTKCISDRASVSIGFSAFGRQSVCADFDGGQISSDGGALLLREAERRLGLVGRLAAGITDPRRPELIEHDMATMIGQRVYGIALGCEDLNDHQTLRNDKMIQLMTATAKPAASPPTLCRMENNIDRKSLWRMAAAIFDTFIQSFGATIPDELILDFDATDDQIHGAQARRFFHGYYNNYCFLPLYVFCGTQLLCAYLRPSNIDASKHTRAILSLMVKQLRQKWPKVRIIVRGDSGFCRWQMMNWCDKHDVFYILGLAQNTRLKEVAKPFMEEAAQVCAETGQTQRVFGEFRYAAGTWDADRRVIVKAEHMVKGENPRFIVTNLGGDSKHLYERVYCARGEMENRIKEQQLGLFADRTSCHEFLPNQLRVMLSAAAYVLIEYIRRIALPGTELENAQVTSIRLKLFKIGARIACSVRRIVLHLSGGWPWQATFRQAAQKLMAVT